MWHLKRDLRIDRIVNRRYLLFRSYMDGEQDIGEWCKLVVLLKKKRHEGDNSRVVSLSREQTENKRSPDTFFRLYFVSFVSWWNFISFWLDSKIFRWTLAVILLYADLTFSYMSWDIYFRMDVIVICGIWQIPINYEEKCVNSWLSLPVIECDTWSETGENIEKWIDELCLVLGRVRDIGQWQKNSRYW